MESVSLSVYPQQDDSIVYEWFKSKSLNIPNLAQFFLYFSFPNLQPSKLKYGLIESRIAGKFLIFVFASS